MQAPATASAVDQAQPAPKFRRILAWLTDVVVATVLSMVAVGFFGYFAPPETAKVLLPLLLAGFVLGGAYFGYATSVFGNTLGKRVFGLRTVGDHGQPVTFLQWTARLLVNAIWPVNAIVMLASDRGRHLGDQAASTRVVFAQPQRSFWLGLVGAIVVVVAAFEIAVPAMKLGIINSSACKTARAYLSEQHPGARVAAFPAGFQLVNDQALFDFRVDAEWDRVILEREPGGRWQVARGGRIDEPSSGVGISFGTTSSD
jgi:uncharacterized RDD family membrane protein YckC